MKIAFFGTPAFAVPALSALADAGHDLVLVVAQPDRPAGRGMKLQAPAVAVRAKELKLPLIQPAKIRDAAFLDVVRKAAPEIAVVIAYGRILSDELLAIPPLGFINVHASLLPKYRGAAPIQRAIEEGETVSGVSIMQVDSELDHGPVYAMSEVAIGSDERSPELAAKLSASGASLLTEVLDRIAGGTAVASEQDHALATYAAKLRKEEGALDFSLPAKQSYDRFRAFHPWPGVAFPSAEGEFVKVIEMRPADGEGVPGRVLSITEEGVLVATGAGALLITQVQRSGRRPMPAREYVLSWGIDAGDLLA